MKLLSILVVSIVALFYAPPATSHEKTVVIPLFTKEILNNNESKLANVVSVSKEGGDFTDPQAAVESITDASADNPYLIVIGPGEYAITETIEMKSYVSITGAGEEATKLIGSIPFTLGPNSIQVESTGAILQIDFAENVSLSNLTIENRDPGGTYSHGIVISYSSPTITGITTIASGADRTTAISLYDESSPYLNDVTLISKGGGTDSYGIYGQVASVEMTDTTVTATGGSAENIAIFNNRSPSTRIRNTIASATSSNDTSRTMGVYNLSSTVTMENVTLTATGGDLVFGMENTYSSVILVNASIVASGGLSSATGISDFRGPFTVATNVRVLVSGSNSNGAQTYDTTSTFTQCSLKGESSSITAGQDSVARVIRSSLSGDASATDNGLLSCINSDNGVDKELNLQCMDVSL